MTIQAAAIFGGTHPSLEFVTDDGTEQLLWGKGRVETLQRIILDRIAERVDEEVRVEDVTNGHRSSAGCVRRLDLDTEHRNRAADQFTPKQHEVQGHFDRFGGGPCAQGALRGGQLGER
jgi:predicted RNA-binding protein